MGVCGGGSSCSLELREDTIDVMAGFYAASAHRSAYSQRSTTGSAQTSAYFQEFFTASEQHAIQLGRVNDAMRELGLSTLPKTREEYRALVEAQDLSTDAGKELFAELMKLAPAFAVVTAAISEASG